MRRLICSCVSCWCLAACEKQEVLPPVPPAPDDLSTWRTPTPWTPTAAPSAAPATAATPGGSQ